MFHFIIDNNYIMVLITLEILELDEACDLYADQYIPLFEPKDYREQLFSTRGWLLLWMYKIDKEGENSILNFGFFVTWELHAWLTHVKQERNQAYLQHYLVYTQAYIHRCVNLSVQLYRASKSLHRHSIHLEITHTHKHTRAQIGTHTHTHTKWWTSSAIS